MSLDAAPLTNDQGIAFFLGRGRPRSLSVGEHTVNASVTDRTGATGACSAMFTVTAATTSTNHAPSVWINAPDEGAHRSQDFTVEGSASDPDGDPLTISVSIDGGWWQPPPAQPMSFPVRAAGLAFGTHQPCRACLGRQPHERPRPPSLHARLEAASGAPALRDHLPPPGTPCPKRHITGRAFDPDGSEDLAALTYRASASGPAYRRPGHV